MPVHRRPLSARARLLALGTLLVLAWGCGSSHPLRPSAMTPELLPPPPSPALKSLDTAVSGDGPVAADPVEYIDDTASPSAETNMRGGRYELTFPVGAVERTTNVKLTQADPERLLFELEPHGAQFAVSVVLSIDYSGTNADPDSPSYDGSMPSLLWYDDARGAWVEVPGVSDVGEKRHIVALSHFSTYSLSGKVKVGGKGGW